MITHPPAPNKTLTHQHKPFYKTGALALIVITLGWAVLELTRIDTLAYFALPAGLAGVTWALLGWQRLIRFLPYILVLSLSLPFWADLVPALVHLASAAVGTWVGWMDTPALIAGNSITVPCGRLIIEDGCSGIRYFAISILLAAMTSVLNDYRWRGWLAGWLASLSVAITRALVAERGEQLKSRNAIATNPPKQAVSRKPASLTHRRHLGIIGIKPAHQRRG